MEHSSTRPHELKRVRKAPIWSVNRLLIALIGVYQRRISPRKGWRCAYSVVHGGPGCSGFAREAIETHGWQVAIPLVRQRFRDCHSAAQKARALRHMAPLSADGGPLPPGPGPGPGRRNRAAQGDDSDSACEACDLFSDLTGCGSDNNASSCHFPSCDSCHIGGCDSCNCDGCDSCSCDN